MAKDILNVPMHSLSDTCRFFLPRIVVRALTIISDCVLDEFDKERDELSSKGVWEEFGDCDDCERRRFVVGR